MARPTSFSEEQKELALKMRAGGYMWKTIAEELGVTRDMVLYHCSDGRKEQVQSAIQKYQKNNYQKMRDKQREYVDNSKVQQETPRTTTETGGVQEEGVGGLDTED